jgi:hypothetical protein
LPSWFFILFWLGIASISSGQFFLVTLLKQTKNRQFNMAFPHDGKKFEEGQSGNPKGRPKGARNRSTVALEWLTLLSEGQNEISGEVETLEQQDFIMLSLIKKAKEGDVQAAKELLDSAYGKAKETIESNHTFTTNPDEFIDSYLNK